MIGAPSTTGGSFGCTTNGLTSIFVETIDAAEMQIRPGKWPLELYGFGETGFRVGDGALTGHVGEREVYPHYRYIADG